MTNWIDTFFFFTEFNILIKSHSKLGTEWINLIKDFYRKLINKSYIIKKNLQKIARIIVSLAKSWHINVNNLKLILFIHILVTSNWKWKFKKIYLHQNMKCLEIHLKRYVGDGLTKDYKSSCQQLMKTKINGAWQHAPG